MNGFGQLMGLLQQAGVELPGLTEDDMAPINTEGAPIEVNGARPPSPQDEYLVPDQGPPPSLSNYDDIQRSIDAAEDVPDRKGRFGVKGTLRSILGTVGDAFLVQSGNKAVYAPQMERENMANAAAGAHRDPYSAQGRLYGQGYADEANQLASTTNQRNYQQGQLQNQQATSQATAANQKTIQMERGVKLLGQASAAVAQNPALWATLGPVMEKIKQESGLGDEYQFPDPTTAPEGYYQGLATAGTPASTVQNIQAQAPYKERAADNADRRATTGEYNARSSRIRAEKAGARSNSNPTNASIAAPLLDILIKGGTLTAKQTEALDRAGYDLPKQKEKRRPNPTNVPPVQSSGIVVRSVRPAGT
jgi:hypothetical protein